MPITLVSYFSTMDFASPGNFFVVDEHQTHAERMITVRARIRDDLDKVRVFLPGLSPTKKADGEHCMWAAALHSEFEGALNALFAAVENSRLENASPSWQDWQEPGLYYDIWCLLYYVQNH